MTSAAETQKQIKVIGPDGKVIVVINEDPQPSSRPEPKKPEQRSEFPRGALKPTATITESQARSLAKLLSSVKSKMIHKPTKPTDETASPSSNHLTSESNVYSLLNPQPSTINPNLPIKHNSSTVKPYLPAKVTPQPSPGGPRSSYPGLGHHGHVIIRHHAPVSTCPKSSPVVRHQSPCRQDHGYTKIPAARPPGSVSLVKKAGPVSPAVDLGNKVITLQVPPGSKPSVNIPTAAPPNREAVSISGNISPTSKQSILRNLCSNSYPSQVQESPNKLNMTVPVVNEQKNQDPILSRMGSSFLSNPTMACTTTDGQYLVIQPKPVGTVKPQCPVETSSVSASKLPDSPSNTYVAMVPTGIPTFYLPVVLGRPPANNETYLLPKVPCLGSNLNSKETNLCSGVERAMTPPTVSAEVVVECTDRPVRVVESATDTRIHRNSIQDYVKLDKDKETQDVVKPDKDIESQQDIVKLEEDIERQKNVVKPDKDIERQHDVVKPDKDKETQDVVKPDKDSERQQDVLKSKTETVPKAAITSYFDTVQAYSECSQRDGSPALLEGSVLIDNIKPASVNKTIKVPPLNPQVDRELSRHLTPEVDKSIQLLDSPVQTEMKETAIVDMDDKFEEVGKLNSMEAQGLLKRKRKVPKRFIAEDSGPQCYRKPRPKCRRTPFVKPIVFYPCFVVLNHLNSGTGTDSNNVGSKVCSKGCREKFLLSKCKDRCIQTCPFYENSGKDNKLIIDHKYCIQGRRGSLGTSPGPLHIQSDHTLTTGANRCSPTDRSLSDMPSVTGAIIRLPNPIDSLASANESFEANVVLQEKHEESNIKNIKDKSFSQPIESALLSPSSETDSALSENYISSEVEENKGRCADGLESEIEIVTEVGSLNQTDFEEPFIKDMNMDSDSEIEFNFAKCSSVSPHPHEVRSPEQDDGDFGTGDELEEASPETDYSGVPKVDCVVPEVDCYTDVERLLEEAETDEGPGTGNTDERCDWGLYDLEVDPDSDPENKVDQSELVTCHVTPNQSGDLTVHDFNSVPDLDSDSGDSTIVPSVGSPVLNERVQRLKAMLDQQKQQLDSLRIKRRRTK